MPNLYLSSPKNASAVFMLKKMQQSTRSKETELISYLPQNLEKLVLSNNKLESFDVLLPSDYFIGKYVKENLINTTTQEIILKTDISEMKITKARDNVKLKEKNKVKIHKKQNEFYRSE